MFSYLLIIKRRNHNSLLRIISTDLSCYNFNLHIVSNSSSFQIIGETKLKTIPKCKLIGLPELPFKTHPPGKLEMDL